MEDQINDLLCGDDNNDDTLYLLLLIVCVLFLNFNHGQPNKGRGEMKELRMLCAEDEQGRTCWMTAFRLFKVVFFPQRSAGFRNRLVPAVHSVI